MDTIAADETGVIVLSTGYDRDRFLAEEPCRAYSGRLAGEGALTEAFEGQQRAGELVIVNGVLS